MGEIGSTGDYVEVEEGKAALLVPRSHTQHGPGTVGAAPFYNRAMAFPRHVSVLVLDALKPAGWRILDGLAATGALGVRWGVEVEGPFELCLNDRHPMARALVEENLRRNGLRGARVEGENLNLLLASDHFDYVDIDPYGSPMPFLEAGVRALEPRGTLGLTATDTATLAGTYPRTCARRYGARPLRAPIGHEVAVRILLGAVVRTAARHDLAARPRLAFWREHYYKVFLEIHRGARRADRALDQIGYVAYTPGGERAFVEEGPIGPLWTGLLHDPALLEEMRIRDYLPAAVGRAHARWSEEAGAPGLFYTTDEVGHALHRSPPAMGAALEALHAQGFSAVRTAFHPKGLKTEATWAELLKAMA